MTTRIDHDTELGRQLAAAIDALGRAETELAALRTVARGYCPACGRGDAAPTVDDWQQEHDRANRLAAALTEVLDRFHPIPLDGPPDAYLCHPLEPRDYGRWRAALGQPAPAADELARTTPNNETPPVAS